MDLRDEIAEAWRKVVRQGVESYKEQRSQIQPLDGNYAIADLTEFCRQFEADRLEEALEEALEIMDLHTNPPAARRAFVQSLRGDR